MAHGGRVARARRHAGRVRRNDFRTIRHGRHVARLRQTEIPFALVAAALILGSAVQPSAGVLPWFLAGCAFAVPVIAIERAFRRSRLQVSSDLVRITRHGVVDFEAPLDEVVFLVPRNDSASPFELQIRHGRKRHSPPWCHTGFEPGASARALRRKLDRLGVTYEIAG